MSSRGPPACQSRSREKGGHTLKRDKKKATKKKGMRLVIRSGSARTVPQVGIRDFEETSCFRRMGAGTRQDPLSFKTRRRSYPISPRYELFAAGSDQLSKLLSLRMCSPSLATPRKARGDSSLVCRPRGQIYSCSPYALPTTGLVEMARRSGLVSMGPCW